MLFMFDVVTGGMRVAFESSKRDRANSFAQIVAQEGLAHRGYQVMVGSDNCGSMQLLRNEAHRQGIAHWGLPPHMFRVSPAEQAISHFKRTVCAVLAGASVEGGPIDESYVHEAAEFVCYANERFVHSRRHLSDTDLRTCYELNLSVPAWKGGLVPFGTAGYAWVPESLRSSRGGKHVTAEPVLCLGWQDMYSKVYKVLTPHGTVRHTSKVTWHHDQPLGKFLPVRERDMRLPSSDKSTVEYDQEVVERLWDASEQPPKLEASEEARERASGAPVGDKLRTHGPKSVMQDRVLDMVRKAGCDPERAVLRVSEKGQKAPGYCGERCRVLAGCRLMEAVGRQVPNKLGGLTPYKWNDLWYDLSLGRLLVDPGDVDAGVPGDRGGEGAAMSFDVSASSGEDPVPFWGSILTEEERTRRKDEVTETFVQACVYYMEQCAENSLHTDMMLDYAAPARPHAFTSLFRSVIPHTPHSTYSTEVADCGKLARDSGIEAFLAMRDLPWSRYLRSTDRDAILKAHHREWDALLTTKIGQGDKTVLEELQPGHPEWDTAVGTVTGEDGRPKPRATGARELLEFKRSGVFKARVVVQGFKEARELLDGENFDYASNVISLTAIRQMFMRPLEEGEMIAQVDVATAFLQATPFGPDEAPRYLVVKDPVTQQLRYFRQHGVVYGSSSAPKRWEDTLYPWIRELDSQVVGGVRVPGFVQGENEKSVFHHAGRKLVVGCYVDDGCIRGPKAEVLWFLEKLAERFNCKDPVFFSEKVPIDHLGMSYFMHEGDVHLTMENYVAAMLVNCDMTNVAGKSTPISTAITDLTPLSKDESKWFMRGNGMCGWLAMTGRPDIKYAHSRISQHMAAPCRGALKALKHLIAYCKETQYWCFRQTAGSKDVSWSFYSDSDHAGNAESQNERRSQLGRMAMLGSVPIDWGSKASSVKFGEDAWRTDVPLGGLPVCHPLVKDLHTDVSSAASEIYAASVALSEFLHLSYVSDEMGWSMDLPLEIQVDNAAAIAFGGGSTRRSKLRHIDVRQQWVTQLRNAEVCRLVKVDTKANLADPFTKLFTGDEHARLRELYMFEQQMPVSAAAS